jgi:hypothetical protein
VNADPAAASGAEPTEEELRKAYEAELSRITTTDMMAQTVISLLNLGARRLGLRTGAAAEGSEPDAQGQGGAGAERDLEQVRDAIDGVRALMGILERTIAQELGPLRDALSQLQMAYAREVKAGAPPAAAESPETGQTPQSGKGPGPAESSGRLWVPGT